MGSLQRRIEDTARTACGLPRPLGLAGLIAGKQESIEVTMEVGPPKPSSHVPVPEEQPGPLVPHSQPTPAWAQRLLLGVEAGIAVWAGILVLLIPWTRLWTENPLLAGWPALHSFLDLTFVRGMISGIGLIDIWMGVADALRFRDLR